MLPPAAWSPKHWVGALGSIVDPTGLAHVRYVGVTEHAILASNLDVILDFTQARRPTGFAAQFYLQTYVVSHVGQKIYQGRWVLEFAAFAGSVAPPPTSITPGLGGTQTLNGYTAILQNGDVAGMLWGIEAAAVVQGLPSGQIGQFANVFIGSIAHGRERGGTP